MGLSALEHGIHWHQLAMAAYEVYTNDAPSDWPHYHQIDPSLQEVWKRVVMAIVATFGGTIDGDLVVFDGKTVKYLDTKTLQPVGQE